MINLISLIWTMVHMIIVFLFLMESRYSRKKTCLLLCAFLIPLVILLASIFVLNEGNLSNQAVFLMTLFFVLGLIFWISKYKDGRFFFTIGLVEGIALEILLITSLIEYYLFSKQTIFPFVVNIVVFPILEYIIYKFFRSHYLTLQTTKHQLWFVFGISSIFFLGFCLQNHQLHPLELSSFVIFIILIPILYGMIFYILFISQRQQLTTLELHHLKNQMDELNQIEKALRIERHHQRHQKLTLSKLIENKHYEEALQLLNASLQHSIPAHTSYTHHHILDAVIQSYKETFNIEVKGAFPDSLPFDEYEFAIVLANLIENAIQATLKLPKENQKIVIHSIIHPQWMFSISNTFQKDLPQDQFNKDHGYGIQIITAFCEKEHLHYDFQIDEETFTFQFFK